jgi:hypothetical protein
MNSSLVHQISTLNLRIYIYNRSVERRWAFENKHMGYMMWYYGEWVMKWKIILLRSFDRPKQFLCFHLPYSSLKGLKICPLKVFTCPKVAYDPLLVYSNKNTYEKNEVKNERMEVKRKCIYDTKYVAIHLKKRWVTSLTSIGMELSMFYRSAWFLSKMERTLLQMTIWQQFQSDGYETWSLLSGIVRVSKDDQRDCYWLRSHEMTCKELWPFRKLFSQKVLVSPYTKTRLKL